MRSAQSQSHTFTFIECISALQMVCCHTVKRRTIELREKEETKSVR